MLEVRGLDVFYGEAQALWELDLAVAEGEVVCIVGPNGAGKTTLVQAIAGMLPVARGSISVGGTDIAGHPAHRVCHSGVAIVPEGRRIFPAMTVADNLDLGAYRRDARASRGQSLAWVHRLFPRLRERSDQLAGSLSGGEQQMLAIGRALMARPRLLLMDEPSLGLAPVVVDGVFEVIGEINGSGVSVLLVEQNVERALEIADRAYLLSEGRIALHGTAAELLANAELRRTVLGVA
ncbi:MAG: ABC transporter ATP-binding protein [Candidatus Limnocylindria bacterium]